MQRLQILALGALLAAGLASPAMAAAEPTTRLVECGRESCLLISGEREDAAHAVAINGHTVAVEGARKWRATIPVGTLRDWSAPRARTVRVAVAGSETEADLPIGLLGHAGDLAMLVVRAQ